LSIIFYPYCELKIDVGYYFKKKKKEMPGEE
jgi:hypothetical protein